jgi:hypothetical protein
MLTKTEGLKVKVRANAQYAKALDTIGAIAQIKMQTQFECLNYCTLFHFKDLKILHDAYFCQ